MDGITALKKIRESDDKTYILMLTAKAEVDDRVTGLDSGADDYITKPFSLKELLARLCSKERREDDYTPNLLTVGDVTLNVEQQNLASHNSIQLSGPEIQLMNYFFAKIKNYQPKIFLIAFGRTTKMPIQKYSGFMFHIYAKNCGQSVAQLKLKAKKVVVMN